MYRAKTQTIIISKPKCRPNSFDLCMITGVTTSFGRSLHSPPSMSTPEENHELSEIKDYIPKHSTSLRQNHVWNVN